MLQAIFDYLFKKNGWHVQNGLPDDIKSCVILAGPHTSNWDTVYALAALKLLKVNARIAIKKELMFFPFGPFLRGVGAISIDRKPKESKEERITAVDAMAALYKTNKNLVLMISPEGTRSPVTKWKTGFYYVAKKANVPIVCSFLDYKTKTAGIGPIFYPADDLDMIMKKIQEFYSTIHPKFPEGFKTNPAYNIKSKY
jgi:1-acyl-sn-glycerol-3-phosphate acyltransferase